MLQFAILADRTAACSMIDYSHPSAVCLSVCPSVCLWRTVLWPNDTSYSKRSEQV